MKKFVVLCWLCIACATTQERSQNLTYSKDSRTGLCFASKWLDSGAGVLTNVPCTPEVLKLIQTEIK